MSSSLVSKADLLRQLHHAERPLVLPNVWDAASARIVEGAGFSAIATTSGGLNASIGWPDGGLAPPNEVFAAVGRISRSVRVPVTADIEDGYGVAPAELVARLLSAGAVGCNLEDSDHRATESRLVDMDTQAERIAAVRQAAATEGVGLVINARIDVFLRSIGPPESRVDEALRRAHAYAAAGADCVFPFMMPPDHEAIRQLVDGVETPMNAAADATPDSVMAVAGLGPKRISVGGRLARSVFKLQEQLVSDIAAAVL